MAKIKISAHNSHKTAPKDIIIFEAELLHSQPHGKNTPHHYSLRLLSDHVRFGKMPTGYVLTGDGMRAISKGQLSEGVFEFGRGEILRQGTHPFVVFHIDDIHDTKKGRYFFALSEDQQKQAELN